MSAVLQNHIIRNCVLSYSKYAEDELTEILKKTANYTRSHHLDAKLHNFHSEVSVCVRSPLKYLYPREVVW